MSYVSDVVLICSEGDSADGLVMIGPAVGLKSIDEHSGGGKVMQSKVFASGVNFLDDEQLISWFKYSEWQDEAILIVKTEEHPYRIFRSGDAS